MWQLAPSSSSCVKGREVTRKHVEIEQRLGLSPHLGLKARGFSVSKKPLLLLSMPRYYRELNKPSLVTCCMQGPEGHTLRGAGAGVSAVQGHICERCSAGCFHGFSFTSHRSQVTRSFPCFTVEEIEGQKGKQLA